MIAVCRSRRDFRRLRAEGRTIRGPHLWTRTVVDPTVDECRVAYALGRNLGTAVTRNRLRRRLRSMVMHHRPRLPPGLLLIGASAPATAAPFDALEAELGELLAEAGGARP